MLLVVPFLILLALLALLWVGAAALLVGYFVSRTPGVFDKMLSHSGDHCACFLGLKRHGEA